MTQREVVTEQKKKIAPKHLVVASGTTGEQHGVFFKLRPSPQSTLEGEHELTVRFVVPAIWRGDSVAVSCQATGQQKFLWLKQRKVWADQWDCVAIYIAGDVEARRAARRAARRNAL